MFQPLFIALTIIAIYLVVYYHIKQNCSKIESYTFTASNNEPFQSENILFVAGTHGNEEGGSYGLLKLLDDFQTGKLKLKRGKITIVPKANPCGLKLSLRWQPQQLFGFHPPDLNRNYPHYSRPIARCDVSKYLSDLAKGRTFVYDGHEGWGFTKIQRDSMGSGVYPGKSPYERDLAERAVNALNTTISNTDLQFISQPEWPDVPGSLRMYCDMQKIPYLLVETSGQNDVQPVETRRDQHYFLAKFVLEDKGMI